MAKRKDPLKAALGALDGPPREAPGAPSPAPLPSGASAPASLIDRGNALSEIGDGSRKDVVHRLVDPAVVRPWAHHNRAYEDLTPARVADLIEGLRAQGRQEFPAIVRRLPTPSSEGHEYEFVCGARRHYAVNHLRANGYPDFRYLIEVRQLSDEEAFRLSDVENRDREDLSDYERARDYLVALDLYYGGQQKRMAERLEMSRSYLSNFLDLGRLPPRIVAAFGSAHALRVHHSRTLKPQLRGRALEETLLRADVIAEFQEERRAAGKPLLQPTVVLAELRGETEKPQRGRRFEVPIGRGRAASSLKVTQRGDLVTVQIPAAAGGGREGFLEAMNALWDEISGEEQRG